MNNAHKIIEEIYEKYSEWLEMMDEEDAYIFILNATATIALNERERADRLKMDLRRCEISRQ